MPQQDFDSVFAGLKAILEPYASVMKVTADGPGGYSLDTKTIWKNGKPVFFGGVRVGKAYVSFHLMPVYANPVLLKGLSPELKKRMQGKACFNFKTPDKKLFKELAELTKAGLESFKKMKFV